MDRARRVTVGALAFAAIVFAVCIAVVVKTA